MKKRGTPRIMSSKKVVKNMKTIRFFTALYVSKALSWAIDIVAKGRGTNLPGEIALKIFPDFISHIRNVDPDKTIFVTGTNGKSTTTNLIAHVFSKAGIKPAVNLAGANLLAGAVVTLAKNTGLDGKLKADVVLLETDERFLPIIYDMLPAKHICITNVQKDQVQRNGEPNIIWRKIASVISDDVTIYVNGNEPNAKSLGSLTKNCITYGVDKSAASFDKKEDFFAVTMPCPVCHDAIEFETYNIDNIGPFVCRNCGFDGRGDADYQAKSVDFESKTFTAGGKKYDFKYNTPFFLYCYIAALAVTGTFGIDKDTAGEAFRDFVNISGRMENVSSGGKTIRYLRMKQENPETVQSALNVIAEDKTRKLFVLGLDELTDFEPHYTNTFYSYDCDFRGLINSGLSHCICFSGTVAYDAALRLIYDGLAPDRITVLPTDDDAVIFREIQKHECENVYMVTWLKKYQSIADYAKKYEKQKGSVK